MTTKPRTPEHFPRMKHRAAARHKRRQQRRAHWQKWQKSLRTLNRDTTRTAQAFEHLAEQLSKITPNQKDDT